MTNAIEMTAKKTLVPNQMCKGELNKSRIKHNKCEWSSETFITYQDIMPPEYRYTQSNWFFYQSINEISFGNKGSFKEILKSWQQIQIKLLNETYDSSDKHLIEALIDRYAISPSLYPYWLLNNKTNDRLNVLPYRWQPIEKTLFNQKKWRFTQDNIQTLSDLELKTNNLTFNDLLDVLNNQSSNTLIIVPNMNGLWLHLRDTLNIGIMHRSQLVDLPLYKQIRSIIQDHWTQKNQLKHHMTSREFKLEVYQCLTQTWINRINQHIDQFILKRIVNLLNEYDDQRIQSVQAHITELFDWLEFHPVNYYIKHPNIMLTTVEHACLYAYDTCYMINPDINELQTLFCDQQTDIKLIQMQDNRPEYKAGSNYINKNQDTLNQSTFRATDFVQHQRCPLIYTCQNKLKVQDNNKPLHKMHLGVIIHAVLADFWKLTKSQSDLKAYSKAEITHLISTRIEYYISNVDQPTPLDKLFWHHQQKKIEAVVVEWLVFELSRPEFEVIATELPFKYQHKDKLIQGRIDRVDYISGLGHVIIDYKTGITKSAKSILAGFPDPQMLLYAKAIPNEVVGLAYAMVYEQKINAFQFKDESYIDWPYYEKPDIDDIIDQHIGSFANILEPNPLETRQCLRCDLQSICHHASSI